MVAVVTNGTAVLGLGAIGALASKPVMEGKAVLFKKFAGIDSIDIEVEERDPAKLIEVVAALEPSFGAINLEDIKAPECFEVERTLRERMRIPVFHDDQHGTAIIVAAAVLNGLILQGKNLSDVKLVNTGGGAAALACLDLLVERGLRRENITVCDIEGVVYTRPQRRHGPLQGPLRPRHGSAPRWTRCWTAPTSSSASPPRACSSPNGWRSSRRSPSSSRWPTPIRRSCPRRCAPPVPTPSSPPAAATTRTRSTTSSASPSSSAARWTWARRRSTRR